jgi:hypothetical protein
MAIEYLRWFLLFGLIRRQHLLWDRVRQYPWKYFPERFYGFPDLLLPLLSLYGKFLSVIKQHRTHGLIQQKSIVQNPIARRCA